MKTEWRRFKPLKEDLSELENLIDKKGLTSDTNIYWVKRDG